MKALAELADDGFDHASHRGQGAQVRLGSRLFHVGPQADGFEPDPALAQQLLGPAAVDVAFVADN
jgi:hypothetical protein